MQPRLSTIVILSAIALVTLVGLVHMASATVAGSKQGDVDCSGSVDLIDAVDIVKAYADLPYERQGACPLVGAVPSQGTSGLSRNDPVPAGHSLTTPEGWQIQILGFTADATQEVLNENQFNDPPKAGHKFSIVRVRMTNATAGNPGDPDAGYALRMVGSANVGYSTFENSCGVIPDDIDNQSGDVFPGGSVEGNVCYEVELGEQDFQIYTAFFIADDADVRWFDVGG